MSRSSTTPGADWANFRPTSSGGITLMQAHFTDHAFERHSHATYAIGVTQTGVQTFNSRGTHHASVNGDLMLFNPDEPHDGSPGTEEGFGYTMLYIEPALVATWSDPAAGARMSRYFADTVVRDPGTAGLLRQAMAALCQPQEAMRAETLASGVISRLLRQYGEYRGDMARMKDAGLSGMMRVRDYLDAHFHEDVTVDTLAALAGLSRAHLTRCFASTFGTPPHVYLNMVRLRYARQALLGGASLADTAAAAGFADQSHFTRRFKRSVGIAPGAWLRQMHTGSPPVPQSAR